MRETYVSLGPESAGIDLLLVGAAILLALAMWIWRKIPRSPAVLFGCLVCGVAGLVGIPQMFLNVPLYLLVVAMLVTGVIDSRWPSMPRAKRSLIEMTAALVIGVPIGAMFAIGSNQFARDRLTLTVDHVDFASVGPRHSLPREDFHAHRAGPFVDAPFVLGGTPRPWYMWLSGGGYWGTKTAGPVVLGMNDYWGPQGVVRGDDVGRRLAVWSRNPILPNSPPPTVAQR